MSGGQKINICQGSEFRHSVKKKIISPQAFFKKIGASKLESKLALLLLLLECIFKICPLQAEYIYGLMRWKLQRETNRIFKLKMQWLAVDLKIPIHLFVPSSTARNSVNRGLTHIGMATTELLIKWRPNSSNQALKRPKGPKWRFLVPKILESSFVNCKSL